MTFSENLNKYMNKEGISQAELARMLNVSSAAVYSWRSGNNTPRIGKIKKICQVLKCNPRDLIEDIDIDVEFSNELDLSETQQHNYVNPNAVNLLIDVVEKNDTRPSKLMSAYSQLNQRGRDEALKRVEEMTELKRYTES